MSARPSTADIPATGTKVALGSDPAVASLIEATVGWGRVLPFVWASVARPHATASARTGLNPPPVLGRSEADGSLSAILSTSGQPTREQASCHGSSNEGVDA